MKWGDWLWNGSLTAAVAVCCYAVWFTWVPAEDAVRLGRATSDLMILAFTLCLSVLGVFVAWVARRYGGK